MSVDARRACSYVETEMHPILVIVVFAQAAITSYLEPLKPPSRVQQEDDSKNSFDTLITFSLT